MNVYTINRSLCVLALSLGALVLTAAGEKTPAAPADQSPEVTALIDRAAIENLMVEYYSHIGNRPFDFGRYFVPDGVLDVNGIVVKGAEEINALYVQVSGVIDAAPPEPDPKAPPRGTFNMLLTNLKIDVKGDTATAAMFWSSVESETLISQPVVTEYGRDRTELVKQNGQWLIKYRVVTDGGGMPKSLLDSYMNR